MVFFNDVSWKVDRHSWYTGTDILKCVSPFCVIEKTVLDLTSSNILIFPPLFFFHFLLMCTRRSDVFHSTLRSNYTALLCVDSFFLIVERTKLIEKNFRTEMINFINCCNFNIQILRRDNTIFVNYNYSYV